MMMQQLSNQICSLDHINSVIPVANPHPPTPSLNQVIDSVDENRNFECFHSISKAGQDNLKCCSYWLF